MYTGPYSANVVSESFFSKQSADQTKILNAKQAAACLKQAAACFAFRIFVWQPNWRSNRRPTITTGGRLFETGGRLFGKNLVTKFETNVQISHGSMCIGNSTHSLFFEF